MPRHLNRHAASAGKWWGACGSPAQASEAGLKESSHWRALAWRRRSLHTSQQAFKVKGGHFTDINKSCFGLGAGAPPLNSWKILRLSTSLCTTPQPSQRAKTEPAVHPWGLTLFTLTVSHSLHVNLTCQNPRVSEPEPCRAAHDTRKGSPFLFCGGFCQVQAVPAGTLSALVSCAVYYAGFACVL